MGSTIAPLPASTPGGRAATGVAGLDDVLGGGLPRDRLYLIEGTPGTGKTTLALQFLLEGARQGERCLYVTLSETEEELRAAAASHGWSLDGISLFELIDEGTLRPDQEQTLLHPSELELGETTRDVMRRVEEEQPARMVFDSLSEMRLLAQSKLRYRRQILALKHAFRNRGCTVVMLDDCSGDGDDRQLHSVAHGVISLQRTAIDYGIERRRMSVSKMRGLRFREGYHDYKLATGGMTVFPRLIAAEHHRPVALDRISVGIEHLDAMLGGGAVRGTSTLFVGPSGCGKTTCATSCSYQALQQGLRVAYFLFDEGTTTYLQRAASLGMDLRPQLHAGDFLLRQIDPAELSPGEFAAMVRRAVEQDGCGVIAIDSLNGYLHAMPDGKFLTLQMHELLSYLNQSGILTLLIMNERGRGLSEPSDYDLSSLSDSVIELRYITTQGRRARGISVLKTRISAHDMNFRELAIGPHRVAVGNVLSALPPSGG